MSKPRHLRARHVRGGRVGRYLPPLGSEFVSIETSSGLALVTAALAALVWVNVDAASYADVWSVDVGPLTLGDWITDGLMALFFFVVGLEIKRELVEGELSDRRHRRAARDRRDRRDGRAGARLHRMDRGRRGGATGGACPMATDIAFALGVLALLGTASSSEAKLFLLALAIVDDIGAIVVIAVFYSSDVECRLAARRGRCSAPRSSLSAGSASRIPCAFLVPGLALVGMRPRVGCPRDDCRRRACAPAAHRTRRARGRCARAARARPAPVHELRGRPAVRAGQRRCAARRRPDPTGVRQSRDDGRRDRARRRQGGRHHGVRVVRRFGSERHVCLRRLDHVQILAVAVVAGIGFTVSLFVAELALRATTLANAKIGILAASVIAGLLGIAAVAITSRHRERPRS